MKHKKLFLPLLAVGFSCLTASAADHYAQSVYSYSPGTQKGGAPVLADRQQTGMALGMPEDNDSPSASTNYVSLGFGGQIVLDMGISIGANPSGVDLQVIETTYGGGECAMYPERVHVYVSQYSPVGPWQDVGAGCQNFGFELPMGFSSARYVRLVDESDITSAMFPDEADGYDVDGIIGYVDLPFDPPCSIAPNAGYGATVVASLQGKRKNGSSVPGGRSMLSRATGLPQMNDGSNQNNFYSLGFSNAIMGAYIDLELNYSFVNQPGFDFMVYETTWGDGPSHNDASYPEQADVYGSDDGSTWYLLTAIDEDPALPAGRIVRDGKIDIGNVPSGIVRYVRIVDASIMSSSKFPGTADGFDVDGVVGAACLVQRAGNRQASDASITIGEMIADANMSVAPNPVHKGSGMSLTFEVAEAGQRTVAMYDMTGRLVQKIADARFEEGVASVSWNAQAANTGLYVIRVSSADGSSSNAVRVMLVD